MAWPAIVFGWPAIGLSLALFAAAFLRPRSALGFAGLALAAPFLWYASHAPGGLLLSPALLVGLGAAAELLRRGRHAWAMACLSPFVFIVAVLAVGVLTQR